MAKEETSGLPPLTDNGRILGLDLHPEATRKRAGLVKRLREKHGDYFHRFLKRVNDSKAYEAAMNDSMIVFAFSRPMERFKRRQTENTPTIVEQMRSMDMSDNEVITERIAAKTMDHHQMPIPSEHDDMEISSSALNELLVSSDLESLETMEVDETPPVMSPSAPTAIAMTQIPVEATRDAGNPTEVMMTTARMEESQLRQETNLPIAMEAEMLPEALAFQSRFCTPTQGLFTSTNKLETIATTPSTRRIVRRALRTSRPPSHR